MAQHYEVFGRLEPARPIEDFNRGFQAEVFDPAWFLGRQWQLGEHQGEDASSPVAVEYVKSECPIEARPRSLALDPGITPTEAIVEAEIQTWTPGQRIRIGAAVAAASTLLKSEWPLLSGLPAPFDRFNGNGYDGRELFNNRMDLGLSDGLFIGLGLGNELFAGPLKMSGEDCWNYEEFTYQSSFKCGGQNLSIERHTGGRIDWYSVDADGNMRDVNREGGGAIPGRVDFPGAPKARWWQIEDAQVDIGGFPPDRSHFPTMLLIDLIASHSNDWFHFPVAALTGRVLTLHDVTVGDSFGDPHPLAPPPGWSLFKVKGLDSSSLVVLPTVASPLTASILENVQLGVNEDSNLVWAVERRLNGVDVKTPERMPDTGSTGAGASPAGQKHYDYLPGTDVYNHWHPYIIPADQVGKRMLVQARLADLTTRPDVALTVPAEALLLNGPNGIRTVTAHQIEPSAVPSLGMSLTRGFVLGRMTDGNPVLWIQRQRLPLISPPALRLRFDVLQDRIE